MYRPNYSPTEREIDDWLAAQSSTIQICIRCSITYAAACARPRRDDILAARQRNRITSHA